MKLKSLDECYGDVSTIENYVKLKVMPTPQLHSTKGTDGLKFFCSLCKTKFKSEIQFPGTKPIKDAKASVLNEWDEHLHTAHPQQWERKQRKRAAARLHERGLHPIRNNLKVNE